MNIEQLTIAEAREIACLFGKSGCGNHPYTIGGNYFLRTVTHHYTGRLVKVLDNELVLENAAWIPDDGRLSEALMTCKFNEVEMYPAKRSVIIGRASLLDAVEIETLPTTTK